MIALIINHSNLERHDAVQKDFQIAVQIRSSIFENSFSHHPSLIPSHNYKDCTQEFGKAYGDIREESYRFLQFLDNGNLGT